MHSTRFLAFSTSQFILPFLNQRVPCDPTILLKVCAGCCLRCDWLQQHCVSLKTGPVLSFLHTAPSAVLQPSNTVWSGFEFTHGINSTKFLLICCCMARGCGCRLCLGRPSVNMNIFSETSCTRFLKFCTIITVNMCSVSVS